MSTNEPMTQERLDTIRGRLDCGTPTTSDVRAMLADNERLRALLTVDDAMVERAARAYFEAPIPGEHDANLMSWDRFTTAFPHNADSYREETRAALDAALDAGEEA